MLMDWNFSNGHKKSSLWIEDSSSIFSSYVVEADDKSQVGSRKEEAVVPLSLLYQKELAAGLFNALLNC